MRGNEKTRALILLCIIYAAFVSVGLPGTLLGTAWPLMHRDLELPLYYAGVLQMMITAATVIASLLSGRTVRRMGAGRSNTASLALVALGLLGFSLLPSTGGLLSTAWLFAGAALLGYGTGALDTGINNFVALHYEERHMNWLHCFYGLGGSSSPFIMSYFLSHGERWRSGYLSVSFICWAILVVLLFSLPLWKQAALRSAGGRAIDTAPSDAASIDSASIDAAPAAGAATSAKAGEAGGEKTRILGKPGVKAALMSFFGLGSLMGLVQVWGSTYIVMQKGLSADTAAGWISVFFIFITLSRLIVGFINGAISSRIIIRTSCVFVILGCLCLFLPHPLFSLAGLILMGFGVAPIIPAIVHENPRRFGPEHSQTVVGYEFASGYLGSFTVPLLAGLAITHISMVIFPIFLLCLAAILIAGCECLSKKR
jgi:fucose permease